MRLTSEQALKMLEGFRGKKKCDRLDKAFNICSEMRAGEIAKALNLDIDKAKALGYIHDIGKGVGEFDCHLMNGYKYIKELGFDEEYANVCLTHSYLNNDIYCSAVKIEEIPQEAEFIKNHGYTIYEKIVNLCDLMCFKNIMTLDKRLIDLIIRRGVHENTVYHIKEAKKLKEYFDNLLGFNVYDLFPDIEL